MTQNLQPGNPAEQQPEAAPATSAPQFAQPVQPVQPAQPAPSYPQAPQMQAPQMQQPQQGAPTPAWASGPLTKGKSTMTTSIISIVAGAISLFLFGAIAGTVAVLSGISVLIQLSKAKRAGAPSQGGALAMAIIGICLGALGLIGVIFTLMVLY
ncbi:hypothetical protein G7068_07505 [Leucobacter viscericola]|uniref:DUF4190 domain-containing protein n=1 Tax=Leucobacter viscericola TaxID=2714935 RepID=A0A6G7XEM1_9MICO|nr:hypothetical protein [Leucobacter viscericola]QIK63060.1 hypothetical protein G7068_07505 [Leucobacter viscericola]